MRGIFIHMNEPQLHLEVFHPTQRYRDAVATLLDGVFELPRSRDEERIDVPSTVQHRTWIKDEAYLLAVCLNAEAAAAMLDNKIGQQVSLLRFLPTDFEGVFDVRHYLYYRNSGDMQVLEKFFSVEDVQKLRFGPQEGDQYHKAIEDAFEQRLHPANDIQYLDFLSDIDSYKRIA